MRRLDQSFAEEAILQVTYVSILLRSIIVGRDMSLGDEESSEHNTSLTIKLCRRYNDVANSSRISSLKTLLHDQR